jgi:hypothetical protein
MLITLTVRAKKRTTTMAERIAIAQGNKGRVKGFLFWPIPVPVYASGEEAADRRRRNYFDSLDEASEVADAIASALAAGHTLKVVVETGVILMTDYDANRYANVVSQDLLREICELASEVKVAEGSEDPLKYVAD